MKEILLLKCVFTLFIYLLREEHFYETCFTNTIIPFYIKMSFAIEIQYYSFKYHYSKNLISFFPTFFQNKVIILIEVNEYIDI